MSLSALKCWELVLSVVKEALPNVKNGYEFRFCIHGDDRSAPGSTDILVVDSGELRGTCSPVQGLACNQFVDFGFLELGLRPCSVGWGGVEHAA